MWILINPSGNVSNTDSISFLASTVDLILEAFKLNSDDYFFELTFLRPLSPVYPDVFAIHSNFSTLGKFASLEFNRVY